MEISLLALIGIGLAAMFFGYFFGLFEGRGQGYKRRRKEEAQGQDLSTSSTQARGDSTTRANLLELARDESGKPLLRLDGRPVGRARMAPEQRKRLIECMILLRPWVEPPDQVPAARTSARPMQDAPSPPTAKGTEKRGPTQPIPDSSSPDVPGRSSGSPSVPATSASLVQQIDAILQERISGTSLADRGIRLAEALHGGAMVFIGQAAYDGVDSVPDPEIQAAIRAAIADWEKTVTRS